MNKYFGIIILACTACAAAGQEGSLNGSWQVEKAGSAAVARGVSLEFAADGRYATRGGCNNLMGEYRAEKGSLKMSDAVSTLKACMDTKLMETDNLLGAAVSRSDSYRIENGRLLILDKQGKPVLEAVRQPENPAAPKEKAKP